MRNPFSRSSRGSETVVRHNDGTVLARVPWRIREDVRYLWTRLQVHGGDLPHSIGITSYLSGEGVTFTSMALGTVLARTGETCLVEANWWGATAQESDATGLVDVLRGNAAVSDSVVKTNQSGLSILPAGNLLASGQAVMANTEAMTAVLGQLHQEFVYVIVDLPAISTSATALSFAAATDASILVARQRVTRVDQVESAVEDLRHTRLLGVVLNGNRVSMPKFVQRRLLDA